MKSISYILVIFIGLGVCNAFGKVEYVPVPQNQSVDEGTKSETEFLGKTRFLSAFSKLPSICGQKKCLNQRSKDAS